MSVYCVNKRSPFSRKRLMALHVRLSSDENLVALEKVYHAGAPKSIILLFKHIPLIHTRIVVLSFQYKHRNIFGTGSTKI